MHLITITMHAVAPGELNGLPDAETNVLLFFRDGTSCEGYYDGDHPDQPGVPFFRDAEGDAPRPSVYVMLGRMRGLKWVRRTPDPTPEASQRVLYAVTAKGRKARERFARELHLNPY